MGRLTEDGRLVGSVMPRPVPGPNVPLHDHRVETTEAGCRLYTRHAIEDRDVAELPIPNMDADDLLRLLGHALQKNQNVLDPRLNILLRDAKVIFERPGAGRFTLTHGEAMQFWIAWGTRIND